MACVLLIVSKCSLTSNARKFVFFRNFSYLLDFLKINIKKNTIRVSNSLDPDQARLNVWIQCLPIFLKQVSSLDAGKFFTKKILSADFFFKMNI